VATAAETRIGRVLINAQIAAPAFAAAAWLVCPAGGPLEFPTRTCCDTRADFISANKGHDPRFTAGPISAIRTPSTLAGTDESHGWFVGFVATDFLHVATNSANVVAYPPLTHQVLAANDAETPAFGNLFSTNNGQPPVTLVGPPSR
jgi:hypothetical protein